MGKKSRCHERHQEKKQDNKECRQNCNNCFQGITNLIIFLVIVEFICKALEEK